jgi:hypothetical protein
MSVRRALPAVNRDDRQWNELSNARLADSRQREFDAWRQAP